MACLLMSLWILDLSMKKFYFFNKEILF